MTFMEYFVNGGPTPYLWLIASAFVNLFLAIALLRRHENNLLNAVVAAVIFALPLLLPEEGNRLIAMLLPLGVIGALTGTVLLLMSLSQDKRFRAWRARRGTRQPANPPE